MPPSAKLARATLSPERFSGGAFDRLDQTGIVQVPTVQDIALDVCILLGLAG